MRGIWAECQGRNSTLSSTEKIEEMFRRLRTANVNTVFLQVYRGNKAWYDSRIADSTPFRKFPGRNNGGALGLSLARARGNGMALHAWLNTFRIWGKGETGAVRKLGKAAVMRDSAGRSLLDYRKEALPDGGLWLDPGDPKVRKYLCGVISELLDLHPDLDGIHLDYTRYPFKDGSKTDYGYGRVSVDRFKKEHGFDPAGCAGKKKALWNKWRRDQITAFIRDVKEIVGRRGKKLSVATIPERKKARDVAFQDWPRWVREGIVDFIVPMNYSSDRALVKRRTRDVVKDSGDWKKVAIGLGAYKVLDNPGELKLQVDDCRKQGVAGVVLFSYDNLTRRPELFSYIGKSVFIPGSRK